MGGISPLREVSAAAKLVRSELLRNEGGMDPAKFGLFAMLSVRILHTLQAPGMGPVSALSGNWSTKYVFAVHKAAGSVPVRLAFLSCKVSPVDLDVSGMPEKKSPGMVPLMGLFLKETPTERALATNECVNNNGRGPTRRLSENSKLVIEESRIMIIEGVATDALSRARSFAPISEGVNVRAL